MQGSGGVQTAGVAAGALGSETKSLMPQIVPTDDELFDIIAKEALVDRAILNRDAALEDLGIASLDVISVLFEVEERFGILVEESELTDCKTLGQLMDKLKARAEADA